MPINQAVVFTKPIHQLDIHLTPDQLSQRTSAFFETKGFRTQLRKTVTGSQLAQRHILRQHYGLYSKAACAEHTEATESAKTQFATTFGKTWEAELDAGHILPTRRLLTEKKIDVHQLFLLWNDLFTAGKVHKIETGLMMAWINELDAYGINAFYPAMEANFYHPETRIDYFVLEFDPAATSWKQFRKQVLGATNAASADSNSFRGRLYTEFPVEFPGRDNFLHGSAGPLESLIERSIHEADVDMQTSPIGQHLHNRGITLEHLTNWRNQQPLTALGQLFNATEDLDTLAAIQILDHIDFSATA